ncbi:TonB protein C-terminal [Aquiflexum balticum DSM 16537]|uniref:TonB protein C-terminal n=1 Tax=Aquiflexum balticum DSM 16537 TaxID=758820 RepID=A0A1W2H0B2_9BACT|nr:energy transducer TonB [Aquiflexum balticum]SMD42214.1 TonB protein C-terminal [Aquiflexum balticum DSM 16537]
MKTIFIKIILLITILDWGVHLNCCAQERRIIPLNEHFFPLEVGRGLHKYNNVISYAIEKELNEKIYTLDNQLIRTIKSTFDDEARELLLWKSEQKFDLKGQSLYSKLYYSNSDTVFTKIIFEENLILDLVCIYANCNGSYFKSDGNVEVVDRNIFEPSFKSLNIWQEFLNRNLTYPLGARRIGAQGNVWVGMKISDSGELLEYAILNSEVIHPVLIGEVNRILKIYNEGFVPAKDFDGNYITEWMYFPVRFVLN